MATPATARLDALGEPYRVLSYAHDPTTGAWGVEAAAALGLDPDAVLKTLVTETDAGELVVAVVPVSTTLDLKAVAATVGAKRVVMASVDEAQRATGYVVGGISPIGQRKSLCVLIDETAQLFDEVYVSAGRRGMDLGLSPHSLCVAANGQYAAIANDSKTG